MAEMRGRDQRRPVIRACDGARIAADLQRRPERFDVVLNRRDGDRVVALPLEGARIRGGALRCSGSMQIEERMPTEAEQRRPIAKNRGFPCLMGSSPHWLS